MTYNKIWLRIQKFLLGQLTTPKNGIGTTIILESGYMIRKATLTRRTSTDEGTFGDWQSDHGFICKTVELPWRDNATGISCVPCGTYRAAWRWSEAHKKNLYHLVGVPMRSEIEIHSANLAGDTAKGYVTQLKGCIAPGERVDNFPANQGPAGSRAQLGVTSSVATLAKLEADMRDGNEQVDFDLTIKEA